MCDDLSGRWVSRSPATNCGSEFWLARTGPGSYDMSMTMCNVPIFGKVTGKTTVEGHSLTTQWKAASCSGTTTMTLGPDCRLGRGEATVTGGLVITCGRGPLKEEIQFVGVELGGN